MVLRPDQNDDTDPRAAANPDAPGEPRHDLQEPVTPVPGVHKETRDHRAGHPRSERHGHEGGGGRDHH